MIPPKWMTSGSCIFIWQWANLQPGKSDIHCHQSGRLLSECLESALSQWNCSIFNPYIINIRLIICTNPVLCFPNNELIDMRIRQWPFPSSYQYFFLLQIISGFWICNLMALSILTYFEGRYHGGGCAFEHYFTPMVLLLITLKFIIVSLTTFTCCVCILIKILKQRAKRSQLGKFDSGNL